jgi:hypothetical protein
VGWSLTGKGHGARLGGMDELGGEGGGHHNAGTGSGGEAQGTAAPATTCSRVAQAVVAVANKARGVWLVRGEIKWCGARAGGGGGGQWRGSDAMMPELCGCKASGRRGN